MHLFIFAAMHDYYIWKYVLCDSFSSTFPKIILRIDFFHKMYSVYLYTLTYI